MSAFLSIVAALLLFISSVGATVICMDSAQVGNGGITLKVQQSNEASPLTADSGCPLGCDTGYHHCHGPCLQHFTVQTVSFNFRSLMQIKIPVNFQDPAAPYLEPARKPPRSILS